MDISAVSDYDYIAIIANYNDSGESGQTSDLANRGYTQEQIEAFNEQVAKRHSVSQTKSLNVRINGDLSRFEYGYMNFIMTAYYKYEVGILPFEGALVDQPAQIIEIFNILEQLKYEAEKKMHDKHARDQARASKGR